MTLTSRTAPHHEPIDRGILAIDRLTMGYFGVTGTYAVITGGMTGVIIAGVHVVLCLLIRAMRHWQPERGFMSFIRVCYPMMAMPAMYAELSTLNRFISSRYYDDVVIGWDQALFGGQPSMFLSDVLPWVPFSEVVHLGYMSYYLILPAPVIAAYIASGREGMQRVSFTVMGTFYTCYMFFIVFPVTGPRYEFERIGGAISEGTMYHIVHAALEGGSSKGTAFPSSHVAATFGALIAAGRADMRWFWAMLVPSAILMFATVYGRFHYAIDAIVGLGIGAAVCLAVPRAYEALRSRQPDPTPAHQSE
jgi:membrane-associated phospholipid phosphatase